LVRFFAKRMALPVAPSISVTAIEEMIERGLVDVKSEVDSSPTARLCPVAALTREARDRCRCHQSLSNGIEREVALELRAARIGESNELPLVWSGNNHFRAYVRFFGARRAATEGVSGVTGSQKCR
jgi:hypothetical protein